MQFLFTENIQAPAGNAQVQPAGEGNFGPLIFTVTENGKTKVGHLGFLYHSHKRQANGTMRYQCEKCNVVGAQCRAYIWERNGNCVFMSEAEHNHEANVAKIHKLVVRISLFNPSAKRVYT